MCLTLEFSKKLLSTLHPNGLFQKMCRCYRFSTALPTSIHSLKKNRSVGDLVKEFLSCFKCLMSVRLKSQILNHLFKLTLVDDGGLEFFKFVKDDFLPLSVRAMETLYKEGKHNLVYHLSKCFESPAPRMDLN